MATEFRDCLVRIALRKGYLDAERVQEAYRLLREEQGRGRPARLHKVLLDHEMITWAQLMDVRRDMAQQGILPTLDDYEILSRIGRGMTGTIYRARRRSLNRVVALKFLAGYLAANESYVQRFLREARMAARVSHPNIVQVYDVGQALGMRYIAMEYVPGRSLEEVLSRDGPISEAGAVSIGLQIAAALDAAHTQGMVHRDLKPGNILVAQDGAAKLADLGLAVMRGEESEGLAGTPYYMSPEQARNDPALDVRSDIYSLGCTLFHAVTGHPPFEGDSAVRTIRMHAEEPAPDARKLRAGLSPAFCSVLRRMMAKRPEDRFGTPTELMAALAEVRRKTMNRRNREGSNLLWALAFGFATLAVLVLLMTIILTVLRQSQEPPDGFERHPGTHQRSDDAQEF